MIKKLKQNASPWLGLSSIICALITVKLIYSGMTLGFITLAAGLISGTAALPGKYKWLGALGILLNLLAAAFIVWLAIVISKAFRELTFYSNDLVYYIKYSKTYL